MSRDRLLIIASLSVGTALLACILSSAYAVLIEPLPFPQSNDIVSVSTLRQRTHLATSSADYDDLSSAKGPMGNAVYIRSLGASVEIDGHTEATMNVSFDGDLFTLFQTPPTLGDRRNLDSARGRDSPAALLSYPAWGRLFGKDPDVLGKIVHLGTTTYEVRAVLSPEYQFVSPADVWVTEAYRKTGERGVRDGRVFARLASGVPVASANAYLASVASALQLHWPATNRGITFEATLLRDSLAGESRLLLSLLAISAAIVLCVAYFNVYQLLAAKAIAASTRWAVCLALGAPRRILFQGLLREPLFLNSAGCALGLLLSVLSMEAMRALSPSDIPRVANTRLVWQIALSAFGISTVAAVLFTLLMLWRQIHDVAGCLHGNLRRGESIRQAFRARKQFFLVAQISLSVTLLISTGMVAMALQRATSTDLGFSAERISITDLYLREPSSTDAGYAYLHQVMQALSTLPGVESVASASSVPFQRGVYRATFTANEAGPESGRELEYTAASPALFDALKIRLLRGRAFSETDTGPGPKVAILNQSAARMMFGNGDCLYKFLRSGQGKSSADLLVVGIVEDIRQDPTTVVAPPAVYVPLTQAAMYSISIVMRTAAPVENATIKARIWQLNANQAVQPTEQLSRMIDASLRRIRYMAFLMTLYAGVTMLLSGMGIYAAVAQWVSSSKKEIALYMALGATYFRVRNAIVERILLVTSVSLLLGTLTALATGGALQSLLYGVKPPFAAALLPATGVLAGVAFLSSYVPALRSRFINPAELLRSE